MVAGKTVMSQLVECEARRPRDSHMYVVRSLKTRRLVNLYSEAELIAWAEIEFDPAISNFTVRPCTLEIRGRKIPISFLIEHPAGEQLIALQSDGEDDEWLLSSSDFPGTNTVFVTYQQWVARTVEARNKIRMITHLVKHRRELTSMDVDTIVSGVLGENLGTLGEAAEYLNKNPQYALAAVYQAVWLGRISIFELEKKKLTNSSRLVKPAGGTRW